MYDAGVYYPIYYSPDLQAYRSDRFEGWIRQPADIGPVMFSNTSPSYFELQPIGGAVGGGVSPVVLIAGGAVASGDHCLSCHELPEEAGNCGRPRVNPRFAVGKIVGALVTLGFVLVFNFFLFRVVQTDPVATLFRGRNIPQARLDQLREEFGLDKPLGWSVCRLSPADRPTEPRPLLSESPAGLDGDQGEDPGDAGPGGNFCGAIGGDRDGAWGWRRRGDEVARPTTASRPRPWSSIRCPTFGWACSFWSVGASSLVFSPSEEWSMPGRRGTAWGGSSIRRITLPFPP